MRAAACLALRVGLLLMATCAPAAAQPYEGVGMRALSMGGAFVGVADDASAVYWNPAGLATGRFFSVVFDTGGVDVDGDPEAAVRQRTTLAAVGTPPLGLSYYRLSTTGALARGEGLAEVRRLRTSYVGVTLVQTLVDGLHLGATLKYVRGEAAADLAADLPERVVERTSALDDRGTGTFDVDLGLMADFQYVRVGLAMRNLREPDFAAPDGTVLTLTRQVRAGVAVIPSDRLTIAADADLRETPEVTGPYRAVAFGLEQRLLRDRLQVRGGLRASTAGPARPTLTAGAGVAVRTGVYVDGYVAAGLDDLAASGGGVGFRVIF